MGLLKGEIASTFDLDLVDIISKENPEIKIVFVGDSCGYENYIRYYRMILASPLAPDYRLLEIDVNGTKEEFANEYFRYLLSEESKMYIATLIMASILGKNILLFFPKETIGLNFHMVLLDHLYMVYGIRTRTETVPFGYDENYSAQNLALIYGYNIITPYDYLMNAGESFTIMAPKLLYDLKIPYTQNPDNPNDLSHVYKYLNDYRLRMLQNNRPLIKPFNMEVGYVNSNRTQDIISNDL